MNPKIVQVDHFSKHYGAMTAVDDISFSVSQGEIFGLLGPNGAGKTTTLECLEGLRLPDAGSLHIAGIDLARETKRLRDVIGVQLQAGGMPETITPDEAIKLFCAYHGVTPRYELLDRFGLTEKRAAQFQQLSTGQQRRLALALAIAHEPQLLFLDEPTAGLDVGSRVELHRLLHELKASGTTIILATHDMAEAEALADRVGIMLNGRLVATGSPLEITATGAGMSKISVHTNRASLLANTHTFPAVSRRMIQGDYVIFFSSNIGQTVPALIDFVTRQGDDLLDLRVERPSLEDRFLELTT